MGLEGRIDDDGGSNANAKMLNNIISVSILSSYRYSVSIIDYRHRFHFHIHRLREHRCTPAKAVLKANRAKHN